MGHISTMIQQIMCKRGVGCSLPAKERRNADQKYYSVKGVQLALQSIHYYPVMIENVFRTL
jgi:hypothetical protein